MSADYGKPVAILKADGGATNNHFLMQFQSDISNIPVLLPQITEITALGAAYVAGLQCGYWNNLVEIEKNWEIKCRFVPNMDKGERTKSLQNWHLAISTTRTFKI